jgi:hypothetical protein
MASQPQTLLLVQVNGTRRLIAERIDWSGALEFAATRTRVTVS